MSAQNLSRFRCDACGAKAEVPIGKKPKGWVVITAKPPGYRRPVVLDLCPGHNDPTRCAVPGCCQLRDGEHSLCAAHRKRLHRTGELGGPVFARDGRGHNLCRQALLYADAVTPEEKEAARARLVAAATYFAR